MSLSYECNEHSQIMTLKILFTYTPNTGLCLIRDVTDANNLYVTGNKDRTQNLCYVFDGTLDFMYYMTTCPFVVSPLCPPEGAPVPRLQLQTSLISALSESEVKTVFGGRSWWNVGSLGVRVDMKVSMSYCSRCAFLPRDLSAHPLHLDSDRIKLSSLCDFLFYCNSL